MENKKRKQANNNNKKISNSFEKTELKLISCRSFYLPLWSFFTYIWLLSYWKTVSMDQLWFHTQTHSHSSEVWGSSLILLSKEESFQLESHPNESPSSAEHSRDIDLVAYTHPGCVLSRLALNKPLMTTLKHALAGCPTPYL